MMPDILYLSFSSVLIKTIIGITHSLTQIINVPNILFLSFINDIFLSVQNLMKLQLELLNLTILGLES